MYRSNFSISEGAPPMNVQSVEPKEYEEIKKREEERLGKQREERKRKIEPKKKEKKLEKVRSVPLQEKSRSFPKSFFAISAVIGILIIGFLAMTFGSMTFTPTFNPTASPTYVATLPPDYTNSFGMEFMKIPAGEFDMGSPSNEAGRIVNEGPVHHVKISSEFYMGKYEVTQKQWREVMGSSPSNFKGDTLPVENVSWNDIQDFIKKLNEKEGGSKYRLPSEAEWEYAARAGTTSRYFFGDDDSNLGDYAWYSENSGSKTHEVGQKKPNPWGLYDVYGNVGEWVQDTWKVGYQGAPTDGSSWEIGGRNTRVQRGCSWAIYALDCRSAFRGFWSINFPGDDGGFRLVRDL